ncbi:hypothetical protein VTN96DRAFT_1119 [Rasamsonia emersonii]
MDLGRDRLACWLMSRRQCDCFCDLIWHHDIHADGCCRRKMSSRAAGCLRCLHAACVIHGGCGFRVPAVPLCLQAAACHAARPLPGRCTRRYLADAPDELPCSPSRLPRSPIPCSSSPPPLPLTSPSSIHATILSYQVYNKSILLAPNPSYRCKSLCFVDPCLASLRCQDLRIQLWIRLPGSAC